MTPDGRFIAGPIPDVPGLWVVSGCNVSGFSFSPAIGEALAARRPGGARTDALRAGHRRAAHPRRRLAVRPLLRPSGLTHRRP
jgi:glycine/D-amino acid oxidase-like deaminating enzyme